MDFFDVIKELRKEEANVNKAGKAMMIFAWICFIGGIWNGVFKYLVPFDKIPFNLPPYFNYLALICGLALGILFFISSKAILKKQLYGRLLGQIAVILFIGLIFSSFYLFFQKDVFPIGEGFFEGLRTVIFILIFLQFGVPAYLGIRYLGRLPVNEGKVTEKYQPENLTRRIDYQKKEGNSKPNKMYKDSFLPFGIFGTFALQILITMSAVFLLVMYSNNDNFEFIFFPAFFFVFFTPIIFNYIASPFQKQRVVIASCTGGGSINLFRGSWPFFRLFVYKDGL